VLVHRQQAGPEARYMRIVLDLTAAAGDYIEGTASWDDLGQPIAFSGSPALIACSKTRSAATAARHHHRRDRPGYPVGGEARDGVPLSLSLREGSAPRSRRYPSGLPSWGTYRGVEPRWKKGEDIVTFMNKSRRKTIISVVVSTLALFLVVPTASAATVDPRLVPPNSAASETGMTYAEWSAVWWQYVFGIPVHDPSKPGQILNPLFDKSGVDCGVGQSATSPVFFLAGVINVSGTATRNECTAQAGRRLFFPVLNVEADNEFQSSELAEGQLRALADTFVKTVTDLHASIDGVAVTNLPAFRTKSPAFTYTMPATDNILGISCSGTTSPECTDRHRKSVPFAGLTCTSTTPSTCSTPAVSDGFWLMLEPLSAGSHTINFGGTFGPPINFTLDITYNLTIQ
jgi:hypothetical protein